MKIERLIGILSILLQREMITAPELAEQFEVSRRTINRDIEHLCRAGIPIMTKQGVHGGIALMENYKISHTLLTTREMQDILIGLQSLDSIHGTNRYVQLMEKLSVGASNLMTGNPSVLIDLSSWYKDTLIPKIEQIRSAIDTHRELIFLYYAPKGESIRQIEPYYLIFRWANWYVWGWCTTRNDFRLFKVNRMEQLRLSDKTVSPRLVPLPDLRNEHIFTGGICVKIRFDADCKWRLIEEFGPNCFTQQADGTLLFQADYTNKENLIMWLLSFGEKAKLLEPSNIRQEIQTTLLNALKRYEKE